MNETAPALSLHRQWVRAFPARREELQWLLTQLGVPPDLRYLHDGLIATRTALAAHGEELATCLRAVPGERLGPVRLVEAIDRVLSWVSTLSWAANDPRMLPIGRTSSREINPLSGYCLGLLHHWANLFYTAEPEPGVGRSGGDRGYASLQAEFSTYVLAAQSTMDPSDYLPYLRQWHAEDRQPDDPPIDDRRLASRVASASRAVRRLSLLEHRELLEALRNDSGAPLSRRLYEAMNMEWSPEQQPLLNAMARLLEAVKPGWERPGGPGALRIAEARGNARGTRREKLRDGYVSLAGGEAFALTYELDEGLFVESIRFRQDRLPQALLDEAEEEKEASALSGPHADEPELPGAQAARARRRKQLEEEHQGAVDGYEWLPYDDLAGPEVVE